MTPDPEESVGLQGFGEMTLRTAVATPMAFAPRASRPRSSAWTMAYGWRRAKSPSSHHTEASRSGRSRLA